MTQAVIETGGKQYRISEGDAIEIEKLASDYKEGDTVVFDKVLLKDDGATTTLGTPYIEDASVEATFGEAGKGDKVTVIRYKAKSRYFKKRGHRQPYNTVTISRIK
ncbi:MAG: 50S ribosomal protein L21 [Parcubacteria group bacterium]|nr:50S ribosomal protein L21 [Parcubacteria group bacterium]